MDVQMAPINSYLLYIVSYGETTSFIYCFPTYKWDHLCTTVWILCVDNSAIQQHHTFLTLTQLIYNCLSICS